MTGEEFVERRGKLDREFKDSMGTWQSIDHPRVLNRIWYAETQVGGHYIKSSGKTEEAAKQNLLKRVLEEC